MAGGARLLSNRQQEAWASGPWLTSQWLSLQVPKLREELEGLQKQADSLGAASEAALQEYQSLKQVTYLFVLGTIAAALGYP